MYIFIYVYGGCTHVEVKEHLARISSLTLTLGSQGLSSSGQP